MGVTRNSSAYGHRLHADGPGRYVISWVIDFKYVGSRLRHPRTFRRYTDSDGAKRFAKKWNLTPPTPQEGKT